MKVKIKLLSWIMLTFLISCIDDGAILETDEEVSLTVELTKLTEQQLVVQSYVKPRPIIAHRGTQEYAPENTEAAYRFARNVGADYIQIDLQMTKDGFLVGFRNDLDNHTNIAQVFPGFETARIHNFTLAELKTLDASALYDNGTYDRSGYVNFKILTLEEIINICEGKMPDGSLDSADNGNRPGIYLRLYQPFENSGIEENLKAELTRLGWYNDDLNNLKVIETFTDKVGVANTKGRVFLASLEKLALKKLNEVFQGKIPTAFWLWKSSNYIKEDNAENYAEFINYGIENGAQFIAPNTSTNDLLKIWQSNLIRRSNAKIQGYTISTKASLSQYTSNVQPVSEGNIYQLDFNLTDAVITNRPQYATYYFGVNILPVENRIVPAPSFLNTAAIQNVFLNLGYQN